MFLGSSVVEQAAVNRLVGGSNPSRGATDKKLEKWVAPFHVVITNTKNHLSDRLAARFSIPCNVFKPTVFSCGEYELSKICNKKETHILILFVFDYHSNIQDQLFQLLMMLESVCDSQVTLFCPNMPYARANDQTYYFLKNIFSPWKVNHFITFESHQSRHYVNSKIYHDISMAPWVINDLREHIMSDTYAKWAIVSPDKGALRSTSQIAIDLNLPSIQLTKERKCAKVSFSLSLQQKDRPTACTHFCIVDDIIDTGNTLYGTAEFLHKNFFQVKKIICYGAHIMSKSSLEKLNHIDLITVADYLDEDSTDVINHLDITNYFFEYLKQVNQ